MTSDGSLERRTAAAIGWNTLGRLARVAFQVSYIIILARVLTPTEFGIASMALIPFQISTTLATRTFTQSLIQSNGSDAASDGAALFLNLFASLCISIAIVIFGFFPPVGADPEVFFMLMLLISICSPISAVSIMSLADLSREMRFRSIAQAETFASAAGFSAGILAFLLLPAVYSIAFYAIGQRVAETLSLFYYSRRMPSFFLDRRVALSMIRYSSPLYATTIFTSVILSIDQMLVAYAIGGKDLGHYNFARRLVDQPVRLIMQAFERALFPAAVKSRNNGELHNRIMQDSIVIITLMSSGVFVFGSIAASILLVPLFGEEWSGAYKYIFIFSFQSCFLPLGAVLYAYIIASGATFSQMVFTVARLVVIALAMLAVYTMYELTAVQIALTIATLNVILLIPNMMLAAKVCGIPFADCMKSALLGVTPAALGAASAWAASVYLQELNDYESVAIQIVSFVIVFSTSCAILAGERLRRIRSSLRS